MAYCIAMTTETAPVHPTTLRTFREQRGLSQRELGRRVAKRLGTPHAIRALQVRLARIEQGDDITAQDRELVDALAAELALGEGDALGAAPKWIWIAMNGGRPTFVVLAKSMLVFSSPEAAYRARDALAYLTHGRVKPMQGATLFAIHDQGIQHTLEVNFRGDLDEDQLAVAVEVDPDEWRMWWLYALEELRDRPVYVFTGEGAGPYGERFEALEELAKVAVEDRRLEAELVVRHSLALRHLKDPPPEASHLLGQWQAEEQAFFDLLTRVQELRREERERTLGSAQGEEP
jgi:hypothetical protein